MEVKHVIKSRHKCLHYLFELMISQITFLKNISQATSKYNGLMANTSIILCMTKTQCSTSILFYKHAKLISNKMPPPPSFSLPSTKLPLFPFSSLSYVAQVCLHLVSLWSLPPHMLGVQPCISMPDTNEMSSESTVCRDLMVCGGRVLTAAAARWNANSHLLPASNAHSGLHWRASDTIVWPFPKVT